ncbi:AAA family ATPase [Butyricicoccus sp. Marseille-Q5471]|uniref:AAA family ATPase n=1 Tax=Butyricicoccus sp. Marseille-Q5471 TaxID=3039493 RepID=UPI0024BC8E4B|nr:AAA family ATPase [Butyricicoccus sp. Marseille-Q5471]
MENRIKTAIQKITLNDHTFSGVMFEPTLINFFFGNNGTGKSTLAKNIGVPAATEWIPGSTPGDYTLMVYNEEFIADNIQSYGNIPGVFTITQQNAEIKAEVDKKTAEKRALDAKIKAIDGKIADEREKQKKVDAVYEKTIWDMTESVRTQYKETQAGYTRDKKKFVAHLETCSPVDIDEAALFQLHAVAYGASDTRFIEYKPIDVATIPTSTLLGEAIVGSSDSAFASFVRTLNASGWLSQGHKAYQHEAGRKCPYCQQDLPDTFEADLASCFDEQYKKSVTELEQFVSAYRAALNAIHALLTENSKNPFTCELLSEYKTKFDLFMERAQNNVALLKQKTDDPAKTVILADLSDILLDINGVIEQINAKIKEYNAVIDAKGKKQQDCVAQVWQLMAFMCRSEIAVHKGGKERHTADIERLSGEMGTAKEASDALQADIGRLNQQTVNTTVAKDSINALLKAAGFQGFYLREKPGAQYVYELIRETDEKVAKGLSEGERHFIAFLYFYHMVVGSQSDDGKTVNKIVVIDDPVSSMDSSSMFTVASLVRDLIAICYNNYRMTDHGSQNDHIKQFFCLTHNPFFFKEVSYNRVAENECVGIYELKKRESNQSYIIECTHPDGRIGGGKVNYSPVKNTYDSLWEEYRTATDSIALINVTRRILEYYYLQICGYSSGDLRSDLLEKNRHRFETTLSDGSIDKTDYNVAAAMLAVLNIGARGFNDGLFFDASAIEPQQIRTVFEKIFKVTEQAQHYSMMMNVK